MSPDIYNCRLNTFNIVVSLITVLMPAIDWVLWIYPELFRAYVIVGMSENLCLAISCVILIWGFKRLVRIVQSTNDHVVKKSVIFWHIVAYFFVVIANILTMFFTKTLRMYEIATICSLVINLACTIILALIVN